MKAAELSQHLKEATGAIERDEVLNEQLSVWTTSEKWVEVATHLRDCGKCMFDYFTFLSAVDFEDEGFEIVLHVYSIRRQHHINVKLTAPRENPSVPTLSGVWRGANWHERETWEMFGINFEGHPHLVKLYLTEAFEGNPLRKDFLLMTREAKEWPGEQEPKEHAG
ncbi:MAG: NADH-quinone oxidoreductase subunit C [Actinomycetota bacterium]|nr:NADH-quinone oxidoreductase subunit C [Actinomycetota bacterium]